jgi:hypothetical protein
MKAKTKLFIILMCIFIDGIILEIIETEYVYEPIFIGLLLIFGIGFGWYGKEINLHRKY